MHEKLSSFPLQSNILISYVTHFLMIFIVSLWSLLKRITSIFKVNIKSALLVMLPKNCHKMVIKFAFCLFYNDPACSVIVHCIYLQLTAVLSLPK